VGGRRQLCADMVVALTKDNLGINQQKQSVLVDLLTVICLDGREAELNWNPAREPNLKHIEDEDLTSLGAKNESYSKIVRRLIDAYKAKK
jgi:hypothetical protein